MTALELADALEAEPDCTCHATSYAECGCDAIWPEQWIQHAAHKLRSLHGELERCKQVSNATSEWWRVERDALLEILKRIERSTYDTMTATLARAAIAKVEEA